MILVPVGVVVSVAFRVGFGSIGVAFVTVYLRSLVSSPYTCPIALGVTGSVRGSVIASVTGRLAGAYYNISVSGSGSGFSAVGSMI